MKLMHFTLRRRKVDCFLVLFFLFSAISSLPLLQTNDKKLRVFEYIICSFRLVHHAKLEFGRCEDSDVPMLMIAIIEIMMITVMVMERW